MILRRRRLSRLGRVDAASRQGSTQLRQYGAQPPIDVKYGGEPEHSRDLAHRAIILEAEYEQEPVVGTQFRDRPGKSCCQLLAADLCVRVARGFVEQEIRIDFLGDELLEALSGLVFLLTIDLLATRPSVFLAKVVEDQSSGDDDEPR